MEDLKQVIAQTSHSKASAHVIERVHVCLQQEEGSARRTEGEAPSLAVYVNRASKQQLQVEVSWSTRAWGAHSNRK